MEKLSTGALFLDQLLNGGYDQDIVTTIYGPSGSGKTNFCLMAAVKVAENGKKVIFVDTEGGIAVERIKQISTSYKDALINMLFFNPFNFIEQNEIMDKLKELINEDIGLIVVDSISMLYRLELGKREDVYDVNISLGRQIATLVEITRKRKIPVLITNQVYSDFDDRNEVKMVGGDLLRYGSKCLIELKRNNNSREFILRKHRSLPEGLGTTFKIVQSGLESIN
ncbi:DNA repair and recombination protein RadB [Candidatus Woesearchaeota archaeon CG_4_10_14_0_2_um_filter_33_13]|nr:MAG: DNA repair and recombination protein RadB [Candidatus Woesearchaeota archaeon CG_4_10_14_0_2_um_filter_33_13]